MTTAVAGAPRRALLSTAAYAGMFVFGIVMALLGAVLTPLSSRLQFQVADIGTLFLVMNFAMLVCSLLMGLIMDRWGTKVPIVAGPLLVGAALALISRAPVFRDLLPAVALLGLGGGALNAATNTLIADIHDDAAKGSALNLLGVFYGIGALFLPFGIGALMSTFGIDWLLWGAAVLCAVFGLFAAPLVFPPPKQGRGARVGDMFAFLGSPLVLAMGALLFLQSGSEFTMGGYLTTFLTRDIGVTVATSSWLLAAYWAALMLSRIVLSRALLAADPHRVVLLCASGAALGCVVIGTAGTVLQATAGMVIIAFSYSGIFPTVLGIAGNHFSAHSGTVFGLLLAIALTGGMSLPWISGQAAAASGLRAVFVIVGVAFVLIAVLSQVVRWLGRRAVD